jgi:hypothetical protein
MVESEYQLEPGEIHARDTGLHPKHLVAMCDVLGFSEMVRLWPLSTLEARYQDLLWAVQRVPGEVGSVVFSDTIVLWSEPLNIPIAEQVASARGFLRTLSRLIGNALLDDLPLRAGLAYGPVVLDHRPDIILGQPIVDAYRTEARQEWIGVGCHSSCFSDELGGILQRNADSGIVSYPVPVKQSVSGPPLEYALDWTSVRIPQLDGWLDDHVKNQAYRAQRRGNVSAAWKWGNTSAFITAMRAREHGR